MMQRMKTRSPLAVCLVSMVAAALVPASASAAGSPIVSSEVKVRDVGTDAVTLSGTINPNGASTEYHFELGSAPGVYTDSAPVPDAQLPHPLGFQGVKRVITGLTGGTTYHYRLVATNEIGTTNGEPGAFRTYPADPETDFCGNALERQQTRASLLLDCRAYEIVSASNAGGYDVESDLIPGHTPFMGYPDADDRALYGLHFGSVPGVAGNPTNFGLDPYVAGRGPSGWSTDYVGLPANLMSQNGAYGSPLLAADLTLNNFAFGGKGICQPCFPDGSSNIPLRLANGEIVKGMAGSLNPAADPTQTVAKPFSSDGNHFVFGSDEKFETLGDESGSIYERNLTTGLTQVVSTLPNGSVITGGNVGELDISADGSRVIVGDHVSTDVKGNDYWHLYMHIGTSPQSVDLSEGTTTGVSYAGMSTDGRRVFYLTRDKLIGADTDSSADIYMAEVGVGGGPASLSLVTVNGGAPSNSDACSPPGSPPWNKVSGPADCSAVAIAGGMGVAADGTIYFISPEQLDGPALGDADQANLFMLRPGDEPRFVATIESDSDQTGQLPNHPIVNPSLISGLFSPEDVTVNQTNGDIYVVERTGARVSRWSSAGVFKNNLTGVTLGQAGRAQVAVDTAPGSPFSGLVYVKKNGSSVGLYEQAGPQVGTLTGFNEVCGLAVDSAGVLYVGDRTGVKVRRFSPISGTLPANNSNYVETSVTTDISPCHVAADSLGQVYVAGATTGPVKRLNATDFQVGSPGVGSTTIATIGSDMEVDPVSNELYVNGQSQISRYSPSGEKLQTFGAGSIGSLSRGVAINATTKHVYATTTAGSVIDFGVETAPLVFDNPAIVRGVQQTERRTYGGFQVSTDGEYAVFDADGALTDALTSGHRQIYRYDATADTVECASCRTTGEPSGAPAGLSDHGLALSDAGQVFFTTRDALVLRDTNKKKDAYEWSNGEVQLISTGSDPEDSGMLSASRDGQDAFFFTRQTLSADDLNGSTVKLYDAREDGGYLYDPPQHACAASDECHGAGTEPPAQLDIYSITGLGAKSEGKPPRCRRGFVRRNGVCKKKKKKLQQRKANRRNG